MAMTPTGRRHKLVKEAINLFYANNPRQLELLILKAHRHALQGNARYWEMIVDRIDGPIKHQIEHIGEITHIVSDADRSRAQEAVERIRALQDEVIDVIPNESLPALMKPEEPERA
jgi:hypothetical protein